MKKTGMALGLTAGLLWGMTSGGAETEAYLIGGPLAGLKLPLFQGQHGEEPGHPGCIPELTGSEAKVSARSFTKQELFPEVELYPGAEEHWRAYYFKYLPQRSFFDRQSQLKNFTAPDIPGAGKEHVESYAAPVYWVPRHAEIRDTGRKRAPVPVVRLKVGAPLLTLDLGELDAGLYAVRVIGAVPTEELRTFRKSAFMRGSVNDGLQGEVTEYKLRIGYCDEFYSVAEFYFHAPEKRAYKAELALDAGSEVDLLVRNISLDDVMAGTVRKPLKTSGAGMPADVKPSSMKPEDRLARDEAIWNYLPPPNHQGSGWTAFGGNYHAVMPNEVDFGVPDKTRKELDAEIGVWGAPGIMTVINDPSKRNLFLVHPKMNLQYTLDDMKAYRPLPDPFPYKDNGTGLTFVDPKDSGRGRVLAEQGMEVDRRVVNYPELIRERTEAWRKSGDSDAARDAAIALARYATVFPTLASATWFCRLVRDPGIHGRNLFDRRRETEAMFMGHYANYLQPPAHYDQLFEYIKGNEELARSIGRFVPWVKTSRDVTALIDTYLVQMTAKRILRYHYHTEPMGIASLAAVLGASDVTAPWWDWLFSGTHIYPLRPAGIQDLMIVGHDRNGAQFIGSTFYAQGEGASRVAAGLDGFKAKGLLPAKYDLTDPALYPKPLAHAYWQIGITVGGLDFPRIGDVCGPDKIPGATVGGIPAAAVNGWRWSGDPAFAWCLKHAGHAETRKGFTDSEWRTIESAAATVKRAPWLELKSRQVYNWMGILEGGTEHDDPLLRRAAYLRTGMGTGHSHGDALDLQYFMLGLPMTIDGGQRPGYTTPPDYASGVHNLVEVDGGSAGQSWVSVLSDGPGARYLRASAWGARLYQRAIALVDADTAPETSYVFDVVRVSGGKTHVYGFHGPVSDEIVCNADMQPIPPIADGKEPTADQLFLKPFKDAKPGVGGAAKATMINSRFAGAAPDVLETTWRYSREPGPGNEQQMLNTRVLGNTYDEKSPRTYTRLHLFNVAGARVYRADALCFQWNYRYVHQMVRRDGGGEDIETAFVALHEPYRGEPFMAGKRLLEIRQNDADARKAVAVEVTLKSGRTDLLFSDGRPEKVREFRSQNSDVRISGEFGCLSVGSNGVRIASLTGGSLLSAPGVEIRAAAREYTGTVTAVDYLKKQITIDAEWPGACAGGVFEIGTTNRTTSYTLAAVRPVRSGAVLILTEGADYFRSRVESVNEAEGIVETAVKHSLGRRAGLDRDFTASNEARTRFWRADMIDDTRFRLSGASVSADDFGPENALRLWEYGVGDAVRQSTFVHVRLVEPGVFEVTANVDAVVTLPGQAAESSSDRVKWRAFPAKAAGGKVEIPVAVRELASAGKLFLRVR